MSKIKREDLPYRPCVGIAVFGPAGNIWAGHRLTDSETPDAYRWQMPQGGIDADEDPFVAAKRELFEETGIVSVSLLGESAEWLNYDLPDELIGKALKGKYRGQTQKWFAFKFDGDEGEINISDPPDGSKPEFDRWEWKPLAAMPDLIVPFKRDLYLQVVDEFSGYAC